MSSDWVFIVSKPNVVDESNAFGGLKTKLEMNSAAPVNERERQKTQQTSEIKGMKDQIIFHKILYSMLRIRFIFPSLLPSLSHSLSLSLSLKVQ